MADDAPRELAELLERLGLADALKARRVRARLRRLGRGLPQFQSVWVDALAQGRFLTPYQAAEIHAGRGSSLRLGPYVLLAGLAGPGYLRSYTARHAETRQTYHLSLIEAGDEPAAERLATSLESLAARSARLDTLHLSPVCGAGRQGRLVWIVQPRAGGSTAGEHLVRHGRMPPMVVLEVARQMAAALIHIEQAGLPHGDLSAATLRLTAEGRVVLSAPGVRPIVRPAEGFSHADLAPEDYDTMAPERIDGGAPAGTQTDLYACGCLWWHLLAGRAPFSGGNALAKLRAHLSSAGGRAHLAPTRRRSWPRQSTRVSARPAQLVGSAAAPAGGSAASTAEGARWFDPCGPAAALGAADSRTGGKTPGGNRVAIGRSRRAERRLVALAAVLWGIELPAPGAEQLPAETARWQACARPRNWVTSSRTPGRWRFVGWRVQRQRAEVFSTLASGPRSRATCARAPRSRPMPGDGFLIRGAPVSIREEDVVRRNRLRLAGRLAIRGSG